MYVQVYNNAKNGIMLHRSCDRAEVYGNYVYKNGDAGLSLYESSDCLVYSNRFFWNERELCYSSTVSSTTRVLFCPPTRSTVHSNVDTPCMWGSKYIYKKVRFGTSSGLK